MILQSDFRKLSQNLEKLVQGIQYDIDNSVEIASLNPQKLAVEELRELAQAGLLRKNLTSPVYQERLEHELDIIHQMGFDDYFFDCLGPSSFRTESRILYGDGTWVCCRLTGSLCPRDYRD